MNFVAIRWKSSLVHHIEQSMRTTNAPGVINIYCDQICKRQNGISDISDWHHENKSETAKAIGLCLLWYIMIQFNVHAFIAWCDIFYSILNIFFFGLLHRSVCNLDQFHTLLLYARMHGMCTARHDYIMWEEDFINSKFTMAIACIWCERSFHFSFCIWIEFPLIRTNVCRWSFQKWIIYWIRNFWFREMNYDFQVHTAHESIWM